MESHPLIFSTPIVDKVQIIKKLIQEITAPDKIILMASDFILKNGIENIYLNLLVTLPSARNEHRRCLRDKIENVCLDNDLFVNVLVHTSAQLNNMLAQNTYFFYMVKKDCLVLFDSGTCSVPELNLPTSEDLKQQGESFF